MGIKTLVTADDFGFSTNINRAIIDAYKKGRVTELSLMIDSYGTDEAVTLIREKNIKDVGLHFSLCRLTRDGKIIKGKEYDYVLANWTKEQLQTAFNEEIDLFVKKVGFIPKHVIGHKQIALHPKLLFHVADYCVKNNCYARANVKHKTLQNVSIPEGLKLGRVADQIFTFQYGSPEEMRALYKAEIESAKKQGSFKTAEFVFHPGYASDFEIPLTSFIQERKDDINFLLSDEFMKLINEENLVLTPSSQI